MGNNITVQGIPRAPADVRAFILALLELPKDSTEPSVEASASSAESEAPDGIDPLAAD